MIKGTTKTGFEFEIDEERVNNMEFIDALTELDETSVSNGNAGEIMALISKLLKFILTKEQKKALYDHVRNDKGLVPIEKVQAELLDIIKFDGNEELKNS